MKAIYLVFAIVLLANTPASAAPPPKETLEQSRDRRVRAFIALCRENRDVLTSGTHDEKIKARDKIDEARDILRLDVYFDPFVAAHFHDARNVYAMLGKPPRAYISGDLVNEPLKFLDESLDAIEAKHFEKIK